MKDLDLEYRFDGADVEEFFHLNAALKERLIEKKSDLWLQTLLPGLSTKTGALVMPFGEGPNRWGQRDEKGEALTPESSFTHLGDAELMVRRDVFKLPKAVAYDEKDDERVLARHFEWTDAGLMVTTRLPYEWVRYSEGRVSIDPAFHP